jgi:hypothetical protein
MLPIIAGIALGLYVLSNSNGSGEKKRAKKYNNELQDSKDAYEKRLEKRARYNENEKRSLVFKSIKREQALLKKERLKLFELRGQYQKGSKLYKQIQKSIRTVSEQIEQKQQDADYVRM